MGKYLEKKSFKSGLLFGKKVGKWHGEDENRLLAGQQQRAESNLLKAVVMVHTSCCEMLH